MKRDSSFCLACFLALVFLILASLFTANADQAVARRPAALPPSQSAPAKSKAEVSEKKISFDTGKKDKKGKSVRREFPVMFDIAARSQKHKAKSRHGK